MGTSNGNQDANLHYPLAFHTAFLKVLTDSADTPLSRFRYIHLSGALVVQDQSRSLWFLPAPRKIKGLAETKMLEFAKEHADRWQTFIVKPGAVLTGDWWYSGLASAVLGETLAIKDIRLGAAMTHLAVSGKECAEDEGVILNKRIIEVGRETLES
jgi:hypothetical protein